MKERFLWSKLQGRRLKTLDDKIHQILSCIGLGQALNPPLHILDAPMVGQQHGYRFVQREALVRPHTGALIEQKLKIALFMPGGWD